MMMSLRRAALSDNRLCALCVLMVCYLAFICVTRQDGVILMAISALVGAMVGVRASDDMRVSENY